MHIKEFLLQYMNDFLKFQIQLIGVQAIQAT